MGTIEESSEVIREVLLSPVTSLVIKKVMIVIELKSNAGAIFSKTGRKDIRVKM